MKALRLIAPLLVGGALVALDVGGPLEGSRPAHAAVSVAHSLDELVDLSPRCFVAKATERRSLWEQVGDGRRIVTYTELHVEEVVYGKPASTLWVRTLGGAVGRIGQQVAGEAQFQIGKRSLVFLTQTPAGMAVVSGAAQGHFPLIEPKEEGQARKLRLSPSLGTILPRRGPSISVQESLHDKQLEEAIALIRDAKARIDASRRKPGK
jgi:hypothetical protein